jgi:hypothetical protein
MRVPAAVLRDVSQGGEKLALRQALARAQSRERAGREVPVQSEECGAIRRFVTQYHDAAVVQVCSADTSEGYGGFHRRVHRRAGGGEYIYTDVHRSPIIDLPVALSKRRRRVDEARLAIIAQPYRMVRPEFRAEGDGFRRCDGERILGRRAALHRE